ncbi:MAG: biotin/lipoyl-binding protein, partial [Candidatus Dadabacteria bacterium]
MSTYEFHLPELGENIESGDVVRVLVAPGDTVAVDQPVLELETDKAVLEVPAPVAGTVTAVHVKEGDEVPVGGLLLTIDQAGEGAATSPPPPPASAAPEPPAAAPAPAPESVDPGEETINEYPPLTPQPQPPAPPQTQATAAPPTPPAAPAAAPVAPHADVIASPAVRRLAREIGVDLATVQGTGPGGRISEADVKAAARARSAAAGGGATQVIVRAPEPEPLDDAQFARWGEIRRETMNRVRRATAKSMAESWQHIPHVTHFDEADITDIDEQRKRLAAEVEAAGGKLTVTAIVLKIIGLALRRFPKFRSSIDLARNELVYKEYIHIGVAVDTDRGLLVPVIRDVDQKDLVELAVELQQISAAARTGKLAPEDMQGAVFTVSNLGGIGGTNFTPLINPPEVAIMGVSRGRMQPVFMHGTFVPRLIMP